jgi:hypothetical protein
MNDNHALPTEVTAGDPASPVGLCTLWTPQERILAAVPRELYALCGNLYSRWGINLLVRSVLGRPQLRLLVVCGVDFADSGEALVALVEHGLDAAGAVAGTDLHLEPDLDAVAVAAFCAQVDLLDLRGWTRGADVAAAIPATLATARQGGRVIRPTAAETDDDAARTTAAGNDVRGAARAPRVQPMAAAAEPPGTPARVVATGAGSTAAEGTGQISAPTFHPDPLGNFLIAVAGGEIVASHLAADGGPSDHQFRGRSATRVARAILAAGLVSQLDHAAYLGAELTRAETALRAGWAYRQGRPLPLPEARRS